MEKNSIKFDHIQGTISKPYRLLSNVGFFLQIGWRRILNCGALQLLARHRPVCTCILCLFVFVFVFLCNSYLYLHCGALQVPAQHRLVSLSPALTHPTRVPLYLYFMFICILCFLYLYFCIIPICICIHLCILKQATGPVLSHFPQCWLTPWSPVQRPLAWLDRSINSYSINSLWHKIGSRRHSNISIQFNFSVCRVISTNFGNHM